MNRTQGLQIFSLTLSQLSYRGTDCLCFYASIQTFTNSSNHPIPNQTQHRSHRTRNRRIRTIIQTSTISSNPIRIQTRPSIEVIEDAIHAFERLSRRPQSRQTIRMETRPSIRSHRRRNRRIRTKHKYGRDYQESKRTAISTSTETTSICSEQSRENDGSLLRQQTRD